jgi:hypothetical protein
VGRREFSYAQEKAEALRAAEGARDHSFEVSRLAAMPQATKDDSPAFSQALRGRWAQLTHNE